jgi:hypothetical protein
MEDTKNKKVVVKEEKANQEQPKPVQINPSITPGNYVIQVISADERLIESQIVTNSKVVIYPVGNMSLVSKMELK